MANTSQRETRYPRYALFWRDGGSNRRKYYTRRKKSILFTADGLTEAREAHFRVVYGKGNKHDGDFQNDSIIYQLPQQFEQLKHDLRIFTSKEEIDSCMGEIA